MFVEESTRGAGEVAGYQGESGDVSGDLGLMHPTLNPSPICLCPAALNFLHLFLTQMWPTFRNNIAWMVTHTECELRWCNLGQKMNQKSEL